GRVLLAERVPSFRRVAKPFTQLGARRNVLEPLVDAGFVLARAARPDPVDEHARSVRFRRLVVYAFHADPVFPCHALLEQLTARAAVSLAARALAAPAAVFFARPWKATSTSSRKPPS